MAVRIVDSADVDESADDRRRHRPSGTSPRSARTRSSGRNCIVGRGAYIGTGVRIGDNCKIQNYALVYEPAVLEDGVFIGPAVVLTNDHFPRAVNPTASLKSGDDWEPVGVTVPRGRLDRRPRGLRGPGHHRPLGHGRRRRGRHQGRARLRPRRRGPGPPDRLGRPGGRPAASRAGDGRWALPAAPADQYVETDGRHASTEERRMTDLIPAAKPLIGDEERAAVDRVLRSGMLAQGPEVAAFEQEFADHFGRRPRLRRRQLRHLGPAPRPARLRASGRATRSSSRRSPSPPPPTRSR